MSIIISVSFILLLGLSSILTYHITKTKIEENIEKELDTNSQLIKSMVEITLRTSIKTQLRTISEKNLEVVSYFREMQKQGMISEEEAKRRAVEMLSIQEIGGTGYVYVLDSGGSLLYHPKKELINQDISQFEFAKKQMEYKDGYIEYEWKNPDDDHAREKALYMSYFEDWDWIISVSSYRSEFLELVDVSDFEEDILTTRFGETGYPIIIQSNGTFLVHPKLKNVNTTTSGEGQGKIIKKIIEMKNGIVEYEWKNPGEAESRKKIAVFREIDDYGWIVASSSYKEEFYRPLASIRNIFFWSIILSLAAIIYITMRISKSIIRPLDELKQTIDVAVQGDLSVRVENISRDEIGALGDYFNIFLESLQNMKSRLDMKIDELENAKNELLSLNENLEERVMERTRKIEETQEKLIQAEKVSAIGKLIADIAHHMNTPIGSVVTLNSFLKRETDKMQDRFLNRDINANTLEKYIHSVENTVVMMDENLVRVSELIDDFKSLRNSVYYRKPSKFKVKEYIEDVAKRCLKGVNVDVGISCPQDIEIASFKDIYESIVCQIVSNSIKHAFVEGEENEIDIEIKDEGEFIRIDISDNGSGMEEEEKAHIFEPFYTGKKDYKNIGLGLNIVYNGVVQILKGEIECQSEIGRGTTIRMRMPKNIDSSELI